jgi:hypothetical protein
MTVGDRSARMSGRRARPPPPRVPGQSAAPILWHRETSRVGTVRTFSTTSRAARFARRQAAAPRPAGARKLASSPARAALAPRAAPRPRSTAAHRPNPPRPPRSRRSQLVRRHRLVADQRGSDRRPAPAALPAQADRDPLSRPRLSPPAARQHRESRKRCELLNTSHEPALTKTGWGHGVSLLQPRPRPERREEMLSLSAGLTQGFSPSALKTAGRLGGERTRSNLERPRLVKDERNLSGIPAPHGRVPRAVIRDCTARHPCRLVGDGPPRDLSRLRVARNASACGSPTASSLVAPTSQKPATSQPKTATVPIRRAQASLCGFARRRLPACLCTIRRQRARRSTRCVTIMLWARSAVRLHAHRTVSTGRRGRQPRDWARSEPRSAPAISVLRRHRRREDVRPVRCVAAVGLHEERLERRSVVGQTLVVAQEVAARDRRGRVVE